MESNGYPECATGLYNYPDTYVSHDFTGATSLLLCEKHGNWLLTSYLVYNIAPCVGKLARSHSVFAVTLSTLKEDRNATFLSTQSHSKEDHILDNDLRDDSIMEND